MEWNANAKSKGSRECYKIHKTQNKMKNRMNENVPSCKKTKNIENVFLRGSGLREVLGGKEKVIKAKER